MKDDLSAKTVILTHPLQAGQQSYCTWGACTLTPRLYHAPLPDGSTLVGWTDSSGNGHVTKVPESGAPITWDYAGEAVRGLVGHADNSFAVLLYMPGTDGIRLSKRDDGGAQVWSAPLNSTMGKPAFLCGDARLSYGAGQYDAYFSVLGIPPCYCDTHYGDQYSQVSDAGVVTLVWFFGQTTHSMAELAGYHAGLNRHTVVSVSDCYPQKGLLADGGHLLLSGDGDCAGDVSVQLGGMAAGSERWAVAYSAMTSGSITGYGVGIAFFGTNYTPTIRWLTNSSGLQERDVCIARLGGSGAPERFLVGWRLQDTGDFMLCVVDSAASILEGPEEINSVGGRWGMRDDSFRTMPDGGVSWVEGQALSDTLRIHTYDPFALTAVEGPARGLRLSVAAAPNPFGIKTSIRFACRSMISRGGWCGDWPTRNPVQPSESSSGTGATSAGTPWVPGPTPSELPPGRTRRVRESRWSARTRGNQAGSARDVYEAAVSRWVRAVPLVIAPRGGHDQERRMIRREDGRVPPEDLDDRRLALEFPLEKPADAPSIPPVRMHERPVERKIPLIELAGGEILRLGIAGG
jgi:hypothetical protein